jgi:hypothetical protein
MFTSFIVPSTARAVVVASFAYAGYCNDQESTNPVNRLYVTAAQVARLHGPHGTNVGVRVRVERAGPVVEQSRTGAGVRMEQSVGLVAAAALDRQVSE